MKKSVLVAAVLLAVVAVAGFGASITITSPKITGYQTKAGLGGWNAAIYALPLGATWTETFDMPTPLVLESWLSINSGYNVPFTNGIVSGGWSSQVAPGGNSDVFTFNSVSVIGAYFTSLNMLAGGSGSGIDVYVNFINAGYTKVAYLNGFGVNDQWGFVADELFTSLTFQGGVVVCCMETYGLDDFSIGSTVPEPGTYALMGAGLIGLAALARRRKA
ncbi:MAG: PEP-CTERM sorting domain-containing protein [Acidobacteria bacterium]|nr:PEP-CTERM sorting domain-containing protein [Acidobacteriota bacterium]